MAAKAKDIAKELGISTATLSLVVNGKPGISKKTREHVISELKRLGYENIIKSEQTETQVQTEQPLSRTIGFIIYKNGGEMLGLNSFYPLILDGVEQTARKFGYNLTVMNMERTLLQEQIHYITDSNCIGYVIFATEMQGDEIKYFEKLISLNHLTVCWRIHERKDRILIFLCIWKRCCQHFSFGVTNTKINSGNSL